MNNSTGFAGGAKGDVVFKSVILKDTQVIFTDVLVLYQAHTCKSLHSGRSNCTTNSAYLNLNILRICGSSAPLFPNMLFENLGVFFVFN